MFGIPYFNKTLLSYAAQVHNCLIIPSVVVLLSKTHLKSQRSVCCFAVSFPILA
ncbi:hypothetical protein RchiOBHm_Chr1g0366381 [Rosa chinensis]|uniref:Uncharacterized protein n=1 Tax=Rosa chinensis TaxID=74649 RepID=A0A2P6SK77_ROSCH|nr:hypothetical protein RchiOBHm_Chr1g0366381 [Rosa chinensis]